MNELKMNRVEKSEETCVVCCRAFNIFAVGVCDHPVCHECSTRMRALCRQSECPICRRDLAKVIFTKKRALFTSLENQNYKLSCKYDIFFEDDDVCQAYTKLLEHVCQMCKGKPIFVDFNSLKEHVKKCHDLFYCDLCIEHLRIFTSERKCYTRQELAQHRRVGDKDDTSHRGHPLCEFCEERYLDNDELFRHLRRQHYFCHFCDADGCYQYYSDYEYLRAHFRKMHFLCEEESCREESFTTVFRSEIDLKAHVATVHKNLTKAQAKHARTLELKFTITPRNGGTPSIGLTDVDGQDRRSRRPKSRHQQDRYSQDNGAAGGPDVVAQRPASVAVIDTNCNIEFPSLSNNAAKTQRSQSGQPASGSSTLANRLAKINRFNVREGTEDFPALRTEPSAVASRAKSSFTQPKPTRPVNGGAASVTVSSSAPVPCGSKNAQNQVTLRINSKKDFPNLSGMGSNPPQPPNVSIHVRRTENYSGPRDASADSRKGKSTANSTSGDVINSTVGYDGSENAQTAAVTTWVTVKKGQKQKEEVTNGDGDHGHHMDFLRPDRRQEEFPSLEPKGKGKKGSVVAAAASVQSAEQVTRLETWDSKKMESEQASKKGKVKKQKAKAVTVAPAKPSPVDMKQVDSKKKKKQAVLANFASNEPDQKDQKDQNVKRMEVKIVANAPKSQAGPNKKIFAAEDFPSLKPKAPPGFTGLKNVPVPPPGFGGTNVPQRSQQYANCAKAPPPGFGGNETQRPVVASNVTFTNSNGEDFPMPTSRLRGYPRSYKQPDDFQNRSRELTDDIRALLDEDEDKFQEFRGLSGRYRQGLLMAEEYYEHCTSLIGLGKFEEIFAELVVLLPDIEKQQDLLGIHYSARSSRKSKCEGGAAGVNTQLLICATCQQVLSGNDFRPHMDLHENDEDFPSLPSQQFAAGIRSKPGTSNVTWRRN